MHPLILITYIPYLCVDQDVRVLIGNEFEASGFNAMASNLKQCGRILNNIRNGASFHVHCNQTLVGRYVVVQMDATQSHLTVCELEVYEEQGRVMTFSCALQKHTKSIIYNIIKHFQIQILVFQNI